MKQALQILFISVIAVSCSGNQGGGQRGNFGKNGKFDKKVDEATPVEVVNLEAGNIGSYILLNSIVETEQIIDVYSQANGFVDKIHVEEGDFVRKGQRLVSLDARELQIRFDKAKLTFEQQELEYKRLNATANQEVFSKEELERIKFDYQNAKLDRDQAKLDLDYATISAPISGVVSLREIKIGQRVNTGEKVYQIARLQERIAIVQVPEKEVGIVKKGQPVKVYSDVLRNDDGPIEFRGVVKRVAPVIDPNSGTFKVTIDIEDRDALRPGMFVNVQIQTDMKYNALLIPKSTIVYDNDRKFVFVVKDSVVKKHDVYQGYEDSFNVETLNAEFKKGDKIVIIGQEGLKDNAKIKVVKNQSEPDSAKLANK